MIPAHHHGRLDFAFRHQVVERQAKFVALAVAQPANSRRQTLKFDAFLRQLDPASQMFVLREHLQHQSIRPRNIGSLSGKRRPAERSLAFAEQRPDICRHKAGEVVGVLHALFERKCSNVVAVIERHRAQLLQIEHAADVLRYRCQRVLPVFLWIFFPKLQRRFQRHPIRHIAFDWIVRARLVRQQIRHDAALRQFRNQVRAISH